jgi:DNA-binding YbaB/EbfC family protein
MSDSDAQMPDMSALLAQAQQMGEQLMAQQAQAQEAEVEGHAGGGAVVVRMTGGGEFLSIKIAPSAVDPDDVEMLEDLVLAALNDAVANAAGLMDGPDLGGLDLGGLDLGGLLGGGD